MRSKLLSMAVILFISICMIPSYMDAEVIPLHISQGQAEMPFIHVLRNGDIMVVFGEGHHFNSDSTLYYRIYSQEIGAWQQIHTVVKHAFSSAFPQIAEDENGNLHMVYMDGNASANREIWYIMYDYAKQEWGQKYMAYVSSGVNSSWPRVRVENGKIYIMWTHNYVSSIGLTDLCMIVNDIGGQWPVPTKNRITISNTGQSASVHNFFDIRDGKIAVIWMDDNHKPGNWEMYYSEGSWSESGKTWIFSKYNHLWPTGNNQYYPALCMDDDYNVHVIFSHKNGPFNYARKDYKTKQWTKPKAVSSGGCSYTHIAYMKYKKGLLHEVHRQNYSGSQAMYYVRGLPSTGQWTDPIRVAENLDWPEYPTVDIDDDGKVHFVFSEGDPDHPRHIYYGNLELPGKPPNVVVEVSKYGGLTPLKVNFDGAKTYDPDGNVIEYRWEFGDGATAYGKKASHTYTQAGDFTAILTAIDNDLLIGVGKVQISVTTGEPVAVIEADPTTGFAPLEVSFDASKSTDEDGTIVSYYWDLGDGNTSQDITFKHTYAHGGSYSVALTVKDDDNKTDTAYQNIRIYERPIADFTATPEKGLLPLTVDFDASASVDNDGTIENFYWNFGDGAQGDGVAVSHTYNNIGSYQVTLIVEDNEGFFDTTSRTIVAYEATNVDAKFTASVTEGVAPLMVDFDAAKSSAGLRDITSYKWNFGDGETAVGKKPSHTFVNPGEYSVILLVEDECGFTGSATMVINVYGKPLTPLGIQYQTIENKSFLFTDYINRVTWSANPTNDTLFNIVQYRIYRKNKGENDSQFTLVGEVSGTNSAYDDRKFSDKTSAENCVYAVTAVDDKGRESDFGKSEL